MSCFGDDISELKTQMEKVDEGFQEIKGNVCQSYFFVLIFSVVVIYI